MARALLLAAAAAAVLAQAPWPQPDGSASHSRAVPVAWPRDATVLTQLNTVPLCSPVLIGANGTLYAAGSDGLLHAFAPSGRELWVVAIGEDICSRQLALNDEGIALFAYLPSSHALGGSESIGVVLLSSYNPTFYTFPANGTVMAATVSRDTITAVVGLSVFPPPSSPPAEPIYSGFVLSCYNFQGLLQWSFDYHAPFAPPYETAFSVIAVRGDNLFVFTSFTDYTSSNNMYASLGALSIATGEVKWHYTGIPGIMYFLYGSWCLSAPSDSVLLLTAAPNGPMQLYALDALNGTLSLWPHYLTIGSGTDFAGSAAGDYLALFSVRVETRTGGVTQLPVPPVSCVGSVFLDSSGALFCVTSNSPDSLILAFDITTGSELLSVEFPLGSGSLAFSASGQLFVGTGAGLFTLLPPSPSTSCTPSPPPTASRSPTASASPPPPPPAAAPPPSAALPALGWSALGACLGVAAALGAVAGMPRLRAWLAPRQPPGPAFAAAEHDYARLN